jgi:hypothetical protein
MKKTTGEEMDSEIKIIDVKNESDRSLLEYNCVMVQRLSSLMDTISFNQGLYFKQQDQINFHFETEISKLKADVADLKNRIPLRRVG